MNIDKKGRYLPKNYEDVGRAVMAKMEVYNAIKMNTSMRKVFWEDIKELTDNAKLAGL